jgi:site-specific DNA-methyltransferase (adenine-specific)
MRRKTILVMNEIDNYVNKVFEGDCLDILPMLPSASIQLVLCDLPYGATQNFWDVPIPMDKLWQHYERLCTPAGVILLTSQGRFTGIVISSNLSLFKYKLVWIKSSATNFLNAKKQPLRKHEDICVFYNKQPHYYPQMTQGTPYDKGTRKNVTSSYGKYNPGLIKNETGRRYPSDVVYFDDRPVDDAIYVPSASTSDGWYHSTQKPVELGRYLIRTFSREGDIVLDNACGSGSFLVAAALENRRYIGMEKNRYHLNAAGQPIDIISIALHRLQTIK